MVDPNIKKKADDIRNKIYGKEVRESLASGLEVMSSDVVENEGRQSVVENRQDDVESQWQAVSDEMTDKDVISAPEIISARNGKPNLKTRIDDFENETTTQLAQTELQQQVTPTVDVYETHIMKDRIVHIHDADDNLYASSSQTGADKVFEKSTDKGNTWIEIGQLPIDNIKAIYKIHATGTLLLIEESAHGASAPTEIYRSVDDGASWDFITDELNFPPLSSQGVTETPDGSILIGEYGNVGNHVYRILRSSDDGVTWTTVLESPGTDPSGDPGHIHSVTYDPYQKMLVAFMDRPHNQRYGVRIYGSSDNGITWNIIGVSDTSQKPNFVSPMYFKDYIAWGSDNERNGVISRIKREDFYNGDFEKAEDVIQLNRKAFYFTFPLRPDVWIVSMATEVVGSASGPEAPGSYMQEHFLVSNNGSVVSGAFNSSLQRNIGSLAGRRSFFPSYKYDRVDHGGYTIPNIVMGLSGYAAIPITQGYGLPSKKINGFKIDRTLENNSFLRSLDTKGNSTPLLGLDRTDRLVLKNGGSEVRISDAGSIYLTRNNVAHISINDENTLIRRLVFATNNIGIRTGSNRNPNGHVEATQGSVYLCWNGGKNTTLWVKESGGSGDSGWVPAGVATGATLERPAAPVVGESFFDTNKKQPIWWNGTDWVDAMGQPI